MTKTERTFVVGDIHGCLGMLTRLMKEIDEVIDKGGGWSAVFFSPEAGA